VDDRTEIVRNAKGEIINYQGIVIDISEHKRLEHETEERRQYLESIFAVSGCYCHLRYPPQNLRMEPGS